MDDRIARFVKAHEAALNYLKQENLAGARAAYLQVLQEYREIDASTMDPAHKDLAYQQISKLHRTINNYKPPIIIPTHLVAAGVLIVIFSFIVFLKPGIVGLASFTDEIVQPVNYTFTETSIHTITLENKPLTLRASGSFEGNVKLYWKNGESLSLVFDSEHSPSEDGRFTNTCQDTCNIDADSNIIELFAQINKGSLTLDSITYKTERQDNQAPVWKSKQRSWTIKQNEQLTLDLNNYFQDPDEDELVYLSTATEGLQVTVEGSTVTMTPDKKGEKHITLIASDLDLLTKVPITITVN